MLYPSRWLVAVLNARGIGFCMRVEKAGNAGFACVRDFLRSGDDERIVTLAPPDRRDATDYECPATPQTVRLVRHVASTGKVRVLMTNLLDPVAFPAHEFGDLYHQRWRIEEAFKRLKHRLNLEHVSGLSQQAALHDFAAKIVCDNLQSLDCLPDLLAPAWHHQIQASGRASEAAQIHESEAMLRRGTAKFGGLASHPTFPRRFDGGRVCERYNRFDLAVGASLRQRYLNPRAILAGAYSSEDVEIQGLNWRSKDIIAEVRRAAFYLAQGKGSIGKDF